MYQFVSYTLYILFFSSAMSDHDLEDSQRWSSDSSQPYSDIPSIPTVKGKEFSSPATSPSQLSKIGKNEKPSSVRSAEKSMENKPSVYSETKDIHPFPNKKAEKRKAVHDAPELDLDSDPLILSGTKPLFRETWTEKKVRCVRHWSLVILLFPQQIYSLVTLSLRKPSSKPMGLHSFMF